MGVRDMDERFARISSLIDSLGVSKWGVADVARLPHSAARGFGRAISLLIGYDRLPGPYDESAFDRILSETRDRMHCVRQAICELATGMGIEHHIAAAGQGPDNLTSHFPHKTAATLAGLGWVGKNALLVTEEHGPRVRLATILVDLDIERADPVSESRCGDCRVCVDACPYGCVTGVEWYPGIDRNLLLNAQLCYDTRDGFVEQLGRRHACGFCLLDCPRG